MANTTNFGWETPDDTDLVKDGAAAIRTLAGAIDTSLVDLKGGTTDQVLAKNSNTDMDFKWVADASGIPATIFDAKGDLIVASAADTAARLAVGGTNGHVLTVNSGATNGIEWAAAGGWSPNLTLLSTTSASGGSTTINVSSYDYYVIRCSGLSSTNASAWLNFRINGSSTAGNYIAQQQYKGKGNTQTTPAYTDTGFRQLDGNTSFIELARTGTNAAKTVNALITIIGGKTTGAKSIQWTTSPDYDQAEGAGSEGSTGNGIFSNSAAITSFTFLFSTGDFDAGDIYVYGG